MIFNYDQKNENEWKEPRTIEFEKKVIVMKLILKNSLHVIKTLGIFFVLTLHSKLFHQQFGNSVFEVSINGMKW